MIEDLAGLSSIKSEVSMTEVNEWDDASEQKHPGVISLALLLERIDSQLVTIGLIVHLGVLFEGHGESVAWEVVTMIN